MRPRSASDLSAVLYPKHRHDNEMVRQFLSIGNLQGISYADEADLSAAVDHLRAGGRDAKEVVILKEFQGRTLQHCPCTQNALGCGYDVINTAFGCLFDCTYCFLNSYLNTFGIQQILDTERILDQLRGKPGALRGIRRIGTGEFTDSLMFDEITGIAAAIIDATRNSPGMLVEFKTKSANIDHLLSIREKGGTVLSWSLNTERVIERYEGYTAGLAERIDAATRAADAGYYTAFHFDPIIEYEGCEGEYAGVIDLLLSSVRISSILWISMGCFRFSPSFRDHVRVRFPDEQLTCAEMFPSFDGKFRYLKQKRVALYRVLYDRITQHSHRIPVYLCMESADVWDSLFHQEARSGRGHVARFHGMIERIVHTADF
ncbi:MAG: hypothetical protein JXA20_20170 [Spirochaetes bacterium]|nr:hypothetical protein [Spirochaetota bacterium]